MSATPKQKPSNASTTARRALVSRVLRSPSFARSERLSGLLSCICELTLEGRSDELNEQLIGMLLFGRKPGYDSASDGIVRTQASRLRQKLDLYFSQEGADEPLRIVLPRGGYVPQFEARVAAEPPPARTSPPQELQLGSTVAVEPQTHQEETSRRHTGSLAWSLAALLCVLVLALGYKLWSLQQQGPLSHAPTNPLLRVFLPKDQPLLVIPGDTGLVMWQARAGHQISLTDYLSGSYRLQTTSTGGVPQDLQDFAERRYTSIVDLNIVKALAEISATSGTRVTLRYARDVRASDLKHGNAILIGAPAANPWVEIYEPTMNFVFFNPKPRQYTILNRNPEGSEPSKWLVNYGDTQHRVYGVVAFLPNVSGDGSVLIIEGTSMAGTECAWDFVADQNQLRPFLEKIKRPDGVIPPFQVLLLAHNLNGNSTSSQVLASREVPQAALAEP